MAPLGGWVDLVAADPPGDFALMVRTNTYSLLMKIPGCQIGRFLTQLKGETGDPLLRNVYIEDFLPY